jgi:hypothetical protein
LRVLQLIGDFLSGAAEPKVAAASWAYILDSRQEGQWTEAPDGCICPPTPADYGNVDNIDLITMHRLWAFIETQWRVGTSSLLESL